MNGSSNTPGLPSPECHPGSAHTESLVQRAVRAALATASLPAIATLDWCERAAGVLAQIEPGAVAGVLLARVTDQGDVSGCEAAGVACSSRVVSESVKEQLANLRWRLESMSVLGWKPGLAIDEAGGRGGRLSQLDIHGWHDSHSGRIFSSLDPSELYVGVVDVASDIPSRRLAAWLAWPSGAPTIIGMTDVFLAVLQKIGETANRALHLNNSDRSVWISAKEKEVLDRLILGSCVRQIAAELRRSPHTVHDHVKSLHRKLGAVSRGDLIARALGYQRTAEPKAQCRAPSVLELKEQSCRTPVRPSTGSQS